ncbi:MAG: RpiB/LacA/LacB family sugar-phosphate isomerase [Candidatus Woesearchaeota archaeon]
MKPLIYIGADHAGFGLKEDVKKILHGLHYKVIDLGNKKLEPTDDYPDFSYSVAKKVASSKNSLGILTCGSAEGMAIVANKVKGIRAVVVRDINEAKFTREHNNANVLCLSGWNLDKTKAKKILKTWLETPFSMEERHRRRVDKIRIIEGEEMK